MKGFGGLEQIETVEVPAPTVRCAGGCEGPDPCGRPEPDRPVRPPGTAQGPVRLSPRAGVGRGREWSRRSDRPVAGAKPGDRVLLNPGISCGRCAACRAGDQPLCRKYRILGEHIEGTAAEYVVVPEANLAVIGDSWSWAEAAAFPLATLTAWRMLTTRARLRAGETILIWGIGGGVGLAAVQIARLLGARVVATSSSDAKLEVAQRLGAHVTLNHANADVARDVRNLTGVGADVVLDSVGEKTWESSLKALRPMGRLVTCGATTGPHVSLDIRKLFWFQWSLLGSTMGNDREFREIVALGERGLLRPVVDSIVPLADGAAAFERLADGRQLGKVVIEVTS